VRLTLFLATSLLLLSIPGGAERMVVFSPQTPAMQHLVRSSGMIFSGVVLQIQRSASGATQITFRVETAIRGVRRGQTVRISEWNGLWNSGERYVKGEHVMLFLYPKSKLGLTSPVGGKAGRYSVNATGQVLVPEPLKGIRPVPIKTFKAAIRRAVQE
jgi:hypothetical protein